MAANKLTAAKTHNKALNLSGKSAVVVGGTSGIGHGIALRLARAGASVTIVGRNEARGASIVAELKEASSVGASFSFLSCDCFSLEAVKECAASLSEGNAIVDYVVLSQGMATLQGFTPTPDGLDQKLTLHVWSRAAFALGLLPALRRSEDGRLISILSAGIHSQFSRWQTDPELKGGSYSIKNAADAAGFYNDIIVDSMSREEQGVTFMHAAPGFVRTRWGTEMPTMVRWVVRGLQRLGRSRDDCGEFMVAGLTASEHKGGMRLLDQFGSNTPSLVQPAHDEARQTTWEHIKSVVSSGKSVWAKEDRKA